MKVSTGGPSPTRRPYRMRARAASAAETGERILRAVQVVVDENVARPTLIGRPKVIEPRIAKFGLRLHAHHRRDAKDLRHE